MFETVNAEVTRLRGETGTLVSALKRPQVRGAWGEMQLRNCVAAANMTEHVDFVSQVTVTGSDGGRLRPDMVVHLPAERDVIVDAKVPMDAYLRALEATGEAEQQELLQQHGRQARRHIDALASKAYHAQFEASPEFVVLFIPNEGVYHAALEADPSLLEHGAAKGVLIATPASLIALLHATHYGWRQEKIAESAREIAAAGRELHKRIATFLEPYAKLGRQLNSAVNAYNQGAGSLDARVLPQLRRLEQAGASSEKPLPPISGTRHAREAGRRARARRDRTQATRRGGVRRHGRRVVVELTGALAPAAGRWTMCARNARCRSPSERSSSCCWPGAITSERYAPTTSCPRSSTSSSTAACSGISGSIPRS